MESALKDPAANRGPEEAGDRAAPTWHIITCEYPPQPGGVSDYTFSVARGLAAEGDEVHVWCPSSPVSRPAAEGVVAHSELGEFAPVDLHRAGQHLDRFPAPRRILLQWVPHGYGYRSMNWKICSWLNDRVRKHGDRLEIMAHEAYLPFRITSIRQSAAAAVHRMMTVQLMRAAERVWVSVPQWEACFRPYALGNMPAFEWLPVPSNIAVADNPGGVDAIRCQYANQNFLIGHFGTFGSLITKCLEPILSELAREPVAQTVLLIGRGSDEFRRAVAAKDPRIAPLIRSTGALGNAEVSMHLAACDLLIQPFPDGVSGRRGSAMACISHGKPVVTTVGPSSERTWSEALPMAPAGDAPAFLKLVRWLRDDPQERDRVALAAGQLYRERFDLKHTVSKLRAAARKEKGV
ncbi:MAG: hypothetical protein LAP38_10800 [Acidobacteriia bacterium]|nr:hypothetical protein [Terriglobia bacterium]